MNSLDVKRGDIFFADLSPVIGSEQGGIRPVVVIQNNIGNKYASTIIVTTITSQKNKAKTPTHVAISANEYGLNRDSVVTLEHVRTLDKIRLKELIGRINKADMDKIDEALNISLNLHVSPKNYNDDNSEIKEVIEAINILKGIRKKYNIEQYVENEERFREHYEAIFSELSKDIKDMTIKLSPFVEKQNIAKGMLTEQAVIEYFKNNEYDAEKGEDELDHLKIDIVAKDDCKKIFTQVKNGQVSAQEIVKLVKSVNSLSKKYDEDNLERVACVCAGLFPSNSDILRMRLESEFGIHIMFIHKYQVIKVCPAYKRTIG